jgi:hypothetical protein
VDFRDAAPILEAVGMAEAMDVPLDPVQLAVELDLTVCDVRERLVRLVSYGLLEADDPVPVLLTAGRQYLREKGATEPEVLRFLPEVFDDLNARRAVLAGGSMLVEELAAAVTSGVGVELARSLVPAVFAPAVTERVAVDLFAAAVALVARLAEGAPAACVAEEVLAVELLRHASGWLDLQVDLGELDADDAQAATTELNALFELFEDDDVLDLFDLREPVADDDGLEGWFLPFVGRPTTGHLAG